MGASKKSPKVPDYYRRQYARLHENGIVEVYMHLNENKMQMSKDYNAIIEEWPVERIKALSELPQLSIHKTAAVLGVTRKTYKRLTTGEYTPSATLCRRMQQIEDDAKANRLFPDIMPNRSEMRRRLLLFRSWWVNRDPSRELPEITVKIHVSWGKSHVHSFDIEPKYIPRMRPLSFAGVVDVVRAVTKSLRQVAWGFNRLSWTTVEEDFWQAYVTDTIPELVKQRESIPSKAVRARKWRPVKT